MTGHRPWKEIRERSKADPDRVREHRLRMERELTLAELRRAREMTQTQLACVLEMTQPGVSGIERRTDLYVSTLRGYVEALGGRLEIVAVFDDGVVPIRSFGELAEAPERTPA